MLPTFSELYASLRPRYPELAGQAALVTGAAGGIGRGIAMRLAREGMTVVLADRQAAPLTALAEDFYSVGARAVPLVVDLSQPGAPERLISTALEACGPIDLLVNNAADLRRVDFLENTEELFDDQIAVNLKAPFLLSLLTARAMKSARETGTARPDSCRSILHISSVGGLRAHWRGLPYDATKSALDGMTRAMALDLAKEGIRVNAIAPGATRHERHKPLEENPHAQAVVQRIPLKRFGTPLDIAAAAAFLASPDAAYITGQVFYVDGGVSAQLSPPGQDI